MEYKGWNDVTELEGIARNLKADHSEESIECIMTEIAPYEYNLDATDLAYIEFLLNQ